MIIMKVPYFKPWITMQDKKSILKALDNRWLTNGPILSKFENSFKKFTNTRFALGVSNATHGLHIILKSLNIKPGDEVLVPTFTFASSADVVTYCGAKPILVDVNPDTFNLSVEQIEKKITKKTKAIIVVHYGGQSCEMDKINSISKKHNLKIIEDCAHALGSTFKEKKCGSFGNAGCFSFYPTKIITTGEGGMISTNERILYEKIKLLRTHGMTATPHDREKVAEWEYDIKEMGYNYRLDEIRSSLGLSQFNRVNKINKMRINVARKYDKGISKIEGLTIPSKSNNSNHIYHLYTIKVSKKYPMSRNELFKHLHKKGIGTSVQYTPLHLLSYFKKKFNTKDFPNANKIKDEILCLPIFPTMSDREINYVINALDQ